MRKFPLFGYENPRVLHEELVRKGVSISTNLIHKWIHGQIPNVRKLRDVAIALGLTETEVYSAVMHEHDPA